MTSKPVYEFLTEGDCKSYNGLEDTIHFNKWLKGYTKKNGSTKFDTKEEAYEAMMNDPEASGIVKSSGINERSPTYNKWTVRRGSSLFETPSRFSPEVSCLKLKKV
jgi:hypothetical protein